MPAQGVAESRWRRLHVRLSVRALMLVVLVVSCALAWAVNGARAQRDAVAAIQRDGGAVYYDQPLPELSRASWTTAWSYNQLGADYFRNAQRVSLGPPAYDELMTQVGRLGALEELDDGIGSQLSDAGLASLAGMSRLKSFKLYHSPRVTGAGLFHLGRLAGLECLVLNDVPMADADLAHLSDLTRLEVLELYSRKVFTDSGLVHLKELVELRSLRICPSRVTTAGLNSLREMHALEVLWLPESWVRDLAPLAHLTAMRNLWLTRTPIDDAGLAPVAGFRMLEALYLDRTQVSDAGLEHLKGLAKLETLSLRGTRITDAGLEHIGSLKGLHVLIVGGTGVTSKGIAALRKRNPNLDVIR